MIQPTELRDAQPPLRASGLGLKVDLGNAPSPLNTKTTLSANFFIGVAFSFAAFAVALYLLSFFVDMP